LFEKILVPLDGSEKSMEALEIALEITKKYNGKITLIHVYSLPIILNSPPSYPISDMAVLASHDLLHFSDGIRHAASNILKKGKRKAKKEGVEVKQILIKGHVVEEILKASNEGKFELIVMGARGLSLIKEIFLGSISEGVVRHALCPVLIIK
jgi:nucleotide-binding universal stress UspA family protein